MTPDVASVRARCFRHGRARKQDALVAQVSGPLLEAVGQEQPFGVFTVSMRGCILGVLTLVADDSAGRRHGRSTTAQTPRACHP